MATSKRATAVKKRAKKRKAAPRKSAPKKAAPRKSTPKKTAPKKAAPRKSTPKKTAPKKAAPKKAAPRKPAPGKAPTVDLTSQLQAIAASLAGVSEALTTALTDALTGPASVLGGTPDAAYIDFAIVESNDVTMTVFDRQGQPLARKALLPLQVPAPPPLPDVDPFAPAAADAIDRFMEQFLMLVIEWFYECWNRAIGDEPMLDCFIQQPDGVFAFHLNGQRQVTTDEKSAIVSRTG